MHDLSAIDTARQERLGNALAEYMQSIDRGELPDREDWLRRYPDLADELRTFFEDNDCIGALAGQVSRTTPQYDAPHVSTPFPHREHLAGKIGDVETTLGDFELLEEIARGGMGVVYKARQTSLNRLVALKVIRLGNLASPEEVLRFRREAEVVAQLDHPHIVPIYEVGEHRREPYFSMKLIEGGNLWDQLPRLKQDPRAAARLLATVAHAVHHAHQHGVLHRDLKPGNVLLDAQGEPHITDFGLAKRLEGGIGLTSSGTMAGTPCYMSPEQATGASRMLTTAADIYGLGAILYEMLTGVPPFLADTPLETVRRVVDEEAVALWSLNPHVDHDLAIICLKCLAKAPSRRYASAQALAEDLERWLRGEPIQARPVSRPERLWRWCRRNQRVASLLGFLVLLVVGGLIVVTGLWRRAEGERQQAVINQAEADWQRDRADEQRQQAVANQAEADRQRDRAERRLGQVRQVVDEFCIQLSQDDLRHVAGLQPVRKKLLEAGLRYYQGFLKEQGADPKLTGEVADAYFRVGLITSAIGSKADTLAAYEHARQMYAALAAGEPTESEWRRQLAACQNNIAHVRKKMGDATAALSLSQEALVVRQQIARDQPASVEAQHELARAYNMVGAAHHDRGELAEALRAYDQSRTIRRQLVHDHPQTAEYQYGLAQSSINLGVLQRQTGQRGDAARTFLQAQALLDRLCRTRPGPVQYQSALAQTSMHLGILHHDAGRYDDALRCQQQALAIREGLARDNPAVTDYQDDLSTSHKLLGLIHRDAGRLKEALACFQASATLIEKLDTGQPGDPAFRHELAVAYRYQGDIHRKLGDPVEALRWLDKAGPLLHQLVADQPNTLQHQRALFGLHDTLGLLHEKSRPADALANRQKARAIAEKLVRASPANMDDRSNLGAALNNEGVLLAANGRMHEALTVYQQAIVHQQLAYDRAPEVKQYRQFLSNHLFGFSSVSRRLGQPDAAAAAALQRRQLWPGNPTELVRVAAEIAMCIPLLAKGQTERSPEEQAERSRYADQAMDALRQSIAAGYTDFSRLQKAPEFAPLRARADFQQLLADLRAKKQTD